MEVSTLRLHAVESMLWINAGNMFQPNVSESEWLHPYWMVVKVSHLKFTTSGLHHAITNRMTKLHPSGETEKTNPITMHGGRLNACALYEFRSDSTGHVHDLFPSRVAKNAKSVMFRHSNRRQRQDHRAIQQSTWQHRKGSYSHKDSQCDNTGCH